MKSDNTIKSNINKVLITGAAGFIGYHVSNKMIQEDFEVVGIDNLDDYYDLELKHDRLKQLEAPNFKFYEMDISNENIISSLFSEEKFDIVVNLAARVGARHSIQYPNEYIHSNITGFHNILESCRLHNVKHLIFASSSSVYGLNENPFSLNQKTDSPISPYAVTKKTNELMAFNYSYLYKLKCTGMRLFTVYGPWGRPDMSYYSFTKAIIDKKPINIFGNGESSRDYTYIADVVNAIYKLIEQQCLMQNLPYFKLYNIGNGIPVKLSKFISLIEGCLGMTSKKHYLPVQGGDVLITHADVQDMEKDLGYKPTTPVEEGIQYFVDWYKDYKCI